MYFEISFLGNLECTLSLKQQTTDSLKGLDELVLVFLNLKYNFGCDTAIS